MTRVYAEHHAVKKQQTLNKVALMQNNTKAVVFVICRNGYYLHNRLEARHGSICFSRLRDTRYFAQVSATATP